MKFFQKYVSLLLVLALCCSFLSVGVLANEEAAAEEIVEEAPAPAIELTVEETVQPEATAGLEEEPPAVIEIVFPTEAPEATEIPVEDVETPAPAETTSPVESEAPAAIEIPVEEPVEEEPEASYRVQHVYVNPLYAHVLSEDDIALPELADASHISLDGSSGSYTTMESAGAYLRGQMVARTESVVISYESTEITTEAEVVALSESLYEFAIGQTGEADEGDYIRWQVGGWGMSAQMSVVDTTWYITYTYQITYYTTAEQEAAVTTAVQNVLESFAFADDTSDYTKIKTIYDYICSNVSYDYINLENEGYLLKYTAYAALINKTSVCQGYALLFYRLAQEAGIDSRIIGGYGTQGETPEAHSWNIVALDGSYYYLDATWDAGYTLTGYSYFLKGSNDFYYHANGDMNGIDYSSEGFLSAYAIAESSYEVTEILTEGDYTFEVKGGEATITAYTGTDVEVIVPATLGGYPVVAIATEAFVDNDTTEKLTFSEGLEAIAGRAIVRFNALEEIYLPSTVSLYSSGNLGADGDLFIMESPKIERIDVSENNTNITSQDGILYNKDMSVLMLYPCGNTQEVFVVPEGVTRIRDGACENNPYVKEVVLPDSLQIIGYFVFTNDYALEKINIPEQCWFIGQFTFRGTSIKELHLPASLDGIAPGALWAMPELESITVEDGNEYCYVENGVLFAHSETGDMLVCYPARKVGTTYTIPDNVSLGWCAFSNAIHLETVVFNDTLEEIPYHAFDNCTSLTNITIPSSVTSIGQRAFGDCDHLATIEIPASVTSIDSSAFANITGMVIFGELGSYAEEYANANGLTFYEIGTVLEGSGSCGENATWEFKDGVLTVMGSGPMTDYESDEEVPWAEFRNAIQKVIIEDGMTSIGSRAFMRCVNLKNVVIPDSVTEISSFAFWRCTRLEGIELPEHLENLGQDVFDSCTSLKTVKIPGSVSSVSGFGWCTSLTSVIIEEGVEYIASYAFRECTALTAITIPASVTSIIDHAFANCSDLKTITFSGQAPSIGDNSFVNVTATVLYPSVDSWTEDVRQHYGGNLTWQSYDSCKQGHSYDAIVTEPTCTAGGYTTYTCEACGDSYTDDETEAKGHSYETTVIEPTCTQEGYTIHSCTVCGNCYTDGETAVASHSYETTVIEPTCTVGGYTTYVCTVCGDAYTGDETEPVGHSYESAVTEPTCTATGYTTYTCACGNSYIADYVNAVGHSYETTVIEPTCTDGGYTIYACTVCEDGYITDEVSATGHSYEFEVTTPPSCTTGGYMTYTCGVCNDSNTDELEPLGHSWDEGMVMLEPTFEAEGRMTYTCTRCGETTEEAIARLELQPGDASGDGKIDATDLVHMVKFILGEEDNIYETGADVTGDGNTNILDVVRLMRYLAGYKVELAR